ncbi:MAG TPA: alpha/beta hydrolase, partial [Gammaproteobacteria bacterium]|nr:alpha/beta hydrolase [Gammaproteobacteria bacterium]
AGGGYDQGLDIGEPLIQSGFRMIAMSRFGYLRTPLPKDASAAVQADAHAWLLDALGIERAVIVGASAGAPSALQFAIRHPERCRALILLVPVVYVPRPGGGLPVRMPSRLSFLFGAALRSDFLFWSLLRISRTLAYQALLATPVRDVEAAGPAGRNYMNMMADHILPVSARRRGMFNDLKVIATLKPVDLGSIKVPTLTISAADDLYGTGDAARYTADQIPGAQFVSYPTGGHMLVGDQEQAAAAISAFLNAADLH